MESEYDEKILNLKPTVYLPGDGREFQHGVESTVSVKPYRCDICGRMMGQWAECPWCNDLYTDVGGSRCDGCGATIGYWSECPWCKERQKERNGT